MQGEDILDVVDDKDQVVGTMTRKESKTSGKKYRIARIVVRDENGDVLIQKRTSTKDTYPSCWDISAAGHVDAGETYDMSAVRELEEEIGVSGVQPKEILYYYSETISPIGQTLNRFTKLYEVNVPHDTQFVCQESEVTEVKWATIDEIAALVNEGNQVTDGLKQTYERYLANKS